MKVLLLVLLTTYGDLSQYGPFPSFDACHRARAALADQYATITVPADYAPLRLICQSVNGRRQDAVDVSVPVRND